MCVRQDGTIGDGYATAPKSVADEPGDDIEFYAATHRLLCYRAYADDVPADGGEPAVTAQEAGRATKAQPAPKPAICPVHFVALPATGRCDDCA